MTIIQNILRRIGYAPVKEEQKPHQRSFAAAAINRATSDWVSSRTTIDNDIRKGNPIVRERARDLEKNNDLGKAFIRALRNNVVGADGFTLQMNVKNPDGSEDESANAMIEDKWQDFCQREHCSVNGQLSMRGIQDLLMIYIGRDGEGPLRTVVNKNAKYGVQLQIIEPELINEYHNTKLNNGNVVKMGVEVNKWRRPINYYIIDAKPELEIYGVLPAAQDNLVIPASQILHGFDMSYWSQTRGISWMVQSMIKMRMLTSYEEAAVINARVAASKMGFFVRKQNQEGPTYAGNDKDAAGNIISSTEPASLEVLPAGMEFQGWDPQFPNQQHELFMKSTLRGITSGLGTAYMSITGDLAEANYSSMRAGLLPERDNYKRIQRWFIETYLQPLFAIWLEAAIMKGQLKFASGKSLPMEKFDKFNKPVFLGRGWPWVDPLKDIQAHKEGMGAGIESPYDIAGEQGKKLGDIYSDIASANKLAKEKGIVINLGADPKTTAMIAAEENPPPAKPKKADVVEEAKSLLESTNGNGSH